MSRYLLITTDAGFFDRVWMADSYELKPGGIMEIRQEGVLIAALQPYEYIGGTTEIEWGVSSGDYDEFESDPGFVQPEQPGWIH